MTTSIVIPAYNGWEYLAKNLPLVLALGADEVIVIDDASTDGTAAKIAKKYPGIHLLIHPQNQRFPISVNDGFMVAAGQVVFLLNQDVTPDKDLLKNTLPFFHRPEVFAVTFNEQQNSFARAEMNDGFLRYFNGPLAKTPQQSFWASGGSAAFRKSVWEELGGFDPIFTPGYYEDLDLGWRARKRGYEIIWAPNTRVTHVRETAFRNAFNPDELVRIKDRNYLYCHWKNLNTGNLAFHFRALAIRCLRHWGYTRPLLMALPKIIQISAFRRREKPFIKKTDYEVFSI